MHRRTRLAASLLAILALVTFALPMSNLTSATGLGGTTGVTAAHAQQDLTGCSLSRFDPTLCPEPFTTPELQYPPAIPAGACGNLLNAGPPTGTPDCKVVARPGVAFNPIGTEHTVTFTCGPGISGEGLTGATAGGAPVTPGLMAGCYNVTASVVDATTGSPGSIVRGTCGATAATPHGGNMNCAETVSPIPATPAAGDPTTVNTATLTIQGGAPHTFTITFTGYTPTFAGCVFPAGTGCCPAGFSYVPGPFTVTSTLLPPSQLPIPVTEGVCQFTVTAEKKYLEVTNVLLTGGPCGGTLLFAEGLKNFFGPGCTLTAYALGTVVLKTGVNCANEPPNNGTGVPGYYPALPSGGTLGVPGAPQPSYSCTNGALSVQNILVGGVNIGFTSSGTGASFLSSSATLGTFCAGVTASGTSLVVPIGPGYFGSLLGASATLCPTGPGTGSVQACLVSSATGTSGGLPNNQPAICSSRVTFTFTVLAQRVVPYVKWAGEKVVLKKCFGTGLRFEPVEFTLKGNNPGLQATLIPVQLTPTGVTGETGPGGLTGTLSGPVGNQGVGTIPTGAGPVTTFPTADTVWTTTDLFGCASVIGYADGEGVMSVDAAIFSTSGASTPLVNEHAFQVFYLKLDHIDLENVRPATYTTATALTPYLGFLARTPAFGGLGPFSETAGEFLGYGTSTPNCITVATTTPGATTCTRLPKSFTLPGPPGSGQVAIAGTGYAVPLCQVQYVRAMVHGYFEYSGDPSGRPAASVSIPGSVNTPFPSAGSYVLPAGRWVLPEDWPLLATFAGFGANGNGPDFTPSAVYSWDINSGWVFNPTSESPVMCGLAANKTLGTASGGGGLVQFGGLLLAPFNPFSGVGFPSGADIYQSGNIPVANTPYVTSSGGVSSLTGTSGGIPINGAVDMGPCFGQDAAMIAAGVTNFYSTAPGSLTEAQQALYSSFLSASFGSNCTGGDTIGINPFDATQACTDPYPLQYSPGGSGVTEPVGFNPSGTPGPATAVCGAEAAGCFDITPTSANSTYLPNGTLNLWDAPMPPAQVSFGITSGPGFLGQVNKTGFYSLTFSVAPSGAACPTGFSLNSSGTYCQQLISGAFTAAQCSGVGGTVVGSLCTGPLQAQVCGSGSATNSRRGTGFNVASGQCLLELDPNPFYAEAIPSMPEIPPVTNNGGYLWNSWNFNWGTITGFVGSSCAFTGTGTLGCATGSFPGGFVAGESTSYTVTPAPACPVGFTLSPVTGLCTAPAANPCPGGGTYTPPPPGAPPTNTGTCTITPPPVAGCPPGYTLNPAGTSCVGPATPPCAAGSTFTPPPPGAVGFGTCTLAATTITCPPGFTPESTITSVTLTGFCVTALGTVTASQCATIPGAVYDPLLFACDVPGITASRSFPGGVNLTNFGNCTGALTPTGGVVTNPTTQVVVGNGTGFYAGESVEVYSTANGTTIIPATGPNALVIRSVTPEGNLGSSAALLTFFGPGYAASCLPAFTAVFIGSTLAVNVGSTTAAGLPIGTEVEIGPNGPFTVCASGATSFVTTLGGTTPSIGAASTASGLIGLCPAEAIASSIGDPIGHPCLLSRGPVGGPLSVGPPAGQPCEPFTLVPPGVEIIAGVMGTPNTLGTDSSPIVSAQSDCGPARFFSHGYLGAGGNANGTQFGGFFIPGFGYFPQGFTPQEPSLAEFCAPPNPYPFWQWLSSPASAGTQPSAATVYSDNHGEAVVSLQQPIASQIPAVCPDTFSAVTQTTGFITCVNGAGATAAAVCPAPYQALSNNGTIVSCLLPFSYLASGTFGTASNASYGNVAAALNAFSAAKPGCIQTFATGTTAPLAGVTVGATGPGAGQICVNSLGGIEFGAAAALGTTTIQAVADYPYTREHAPIGSAPLTKVFTSAFAKTLTVSPGTAAPAGTTSYVVTVTATDVCGNPIIGEPVQVFVLGAPGAAVLAPVSTGGVINASSTSATVLVNPTGPNAGTATLSLEVLNTAVGTQGLVVKAVWPFERIERFVTVIPGTTPGQTATVVYPPGWQQVGGPPGSNFSVAEALFAWNTSTQSYSNATAAAGNISSAAPACTGYWAYFAAAMAVSLPATSKSGDTAACTLASGWNLIGNPFASPATIGGGQTAYHWNGTSYDVVGVIPVGGSVWLFAPASGTVTLTAT